MSNFDRTVFLNQVKSWSNQYLITESTVHIDNYSDQAQLIILSEIENRNIDLKNNDMESSGNTVNSEKIVVFEGNPYESTLIKAHLETSNITAYTNGDFYGDFNHNNTAQIAVDIQNELRAKDLVADFLSNSTADITESIDFEEDEKTDTKESPIHPYNIQIWKFIILTFISPFAFLAYYIYRQWKYMNTFPHSGYKISPVFPALLQNLAFFKLYNFMYIQNNKHDELHKILSYLLPTISISISILAFKVPREYALFGFSAIIPLLPLVYEANRNKNCIKRKYFLSLSEIIIILIGTLLYVFVFSKLV